MKSKIYCITNKIARCVPIDCGYDTVGEFNIVCDDLKCKVFFITDTYTV